MDSFEKLQEIGSKKIASVTHVPVHFVEKILLKDFSQFSQVQLFGFLSIFEREFKVDMSAVKQEFLFDKAQKEIKEHESFDLTEGALKLNKKALYGGSASTLLVILLIIFFSLGEDKSSAEAEEATKVEINNSAIEKAKQNLKMEPTDINDVEMPMAENEVESAEHGQDKTVQKSTQDKTVSTKVQEPMMPLHFRVVPHGKLWIGIINAETYRRKVKTTAEPFELDPKKEWLLVTGYGYVDIESGDTVQKFKEETKLYFLYENGVAQRIDKTEFKARNRNKSW